jgi:SAM-dependent methyltransferase
VSATDPWSANAAFWDAHMGDAGNEWHLRLIRPAVERLLGPVAGERVLDVACGNGLFARRLTELGAHVTATDVSEPMLEHARRHETEETAGIEYRLCDVTDGEALRGLGPGAFDAVVCTMALMDIPEIAPLASALPRLLTAGGRFVFSITHPCFNRLGTRFVAESEYDAGELVSRRGLLISRYLTPETGEGVAIEGQPANQLYFDRPLSLLFAPFFAAGLALDALEEPAFPEGEAGSGLGWKGMPELPPILVARLRCQIGTGP